MRCYALAYAIECSKNFERPNHEIRNFIKDVRPYSQKKGVSFAGHRLKLKFETRRESIHPVKLVGPEGTL